VTQSSITNPKIVEEKLKEVRWEYADKDPNAVGILTKRIEEIGRKFGLISYSDLVKGVTFSFPNIRSGAPYTIDTWDWSGLDRRILGDCLGYISAQSYLAHGFMASALVIGRVNSQPSDIFFNWMKDLKILPDTKESTILKFWQGEVDKAHKWYKYRGNPPVLS
jgi:hypothetical protein